MTLVNQPTYRPTRKIMAIIIAGAVAGAVNQALAIFWPDHPFAPIMDDFEIWVQMGIMVIAGYMTKEKDVTQPNQNHPELSIPPVTGDTGVWRSQTSPRQGPR